VLRDGMTLERRRLLRAIALGLTVSACGPFSSALMGSSAMQPAVTTRSAAGGATATTVPAQGVTYLAPAAAASQPSTSTIVAGPSWRRPAAKNDVIRYRLRLAENPVDPQGARQCYSECRTAKTEDLLLKCLAECPGFEVDRGVTCGKREGPPHSLCLTHRTVPLASEPDPGLVLVAVVADFAIYVGLSAACSISNPPCAMTWW
jgi:hypothetical protein